MMCSLTTTVATLSILCYITPTALGFFFDIFPYPFFESIISRDDDLYKTIGPSPTERVRKHGYTSETHSVETQDGYILQMHRITGTRGDSNPDQKPVVLLMHGLLDCSSTWVLGSTERSLGRANGRRYMFANRGYDVWLGNIRGNRYGRNNTYLNPREKQFWMYSWHEMGMYDLPALIDHILKVTKQEKLIYVGHSQGCTAFFVLASMRPQYRKKIDIMVALAPAVFVSHTTIPFFRILTELREETQAVADQIGLYEFIPTPPFLQKVSTTFCGTNLLTQPFCDMDIAILLAPGEKLMNKTLVSEALQYDPAGASVKDFLHYTQLISTGKFQQYDHGLWNTMEYASMNPPEYPIEEIDIPICIYYGANDAFVVPKDVDILASKLQNVRKFLIPEPSFSHVDFVWSDEAGTLVYDQLLNHIADHLNKK